MVPVIVSTKQDVTVCVCVCVCCQYRHAQLYVYYLNHISIYDNKVYLGEGDEPSSYTAEIYAQC